MTALLSACLIVKNEADNLARCLSSITAIADEVVVVDTGSTDTTVEIAEAHGARVFHHTWTNDYASARNVSLGHARGAFILYIDADEELHADDVEPLRACLASGSVDAVEMSIVSPLGSGATNVARYLRVFRNYPGIHFVNAIHEQIWPALSMHQPRVVASSWRIIHHGYAVSEKEREAKCRRNLEGALEVLQQDPDNAFYLYHVGIGHLTLGEPSKGLPWLERALRHGSVQEKPVILNAMAQAHFDLKQHAEAEGLLRQSVEAQSRQHHGWGLLAEVLLISQRHQEAILALRSLLEVTTSHLHTDLQPDHAGAYLKLGMCELLTHDAPQAVQHLHAALATRTLDERDTATAERYMAMAERMRDRGAG